MMTVDVHSQVEPKLKSEAMAVLKAAGLDISTAIRLFLHRVVETGGMPIELTRHNSTTIAAIKAAKAGKITEITIDNL
ncbi:MAG: type II toxin-antitoxin system RelB/DinJ family antitoxin [Candidatus Omnitrophica bacterium]|nr:type II toxin-antitoxin system RelB/DinJ family antitoxin [Candidatus Omnitrophota bacterium]